MRKLEIKKQFAVNKNNQWFKIAAGEIAQFFEKEYREVIWIFWKFQRINIDRAYQIAKNEDDKAFNHFLQNCK